MSFVEARFPECVSFGSAGGPGFRTSIFELDSGYVAANIEWERIRAQYDVTFENATPADIVEVEEFFYSMRGRAIGFRYKDWGDYTIANQNIFLGDGSKTVFDIFKRYSSGGIHYDRPIKKIVAGTLTQINVDGVAKMVTTDFTVQTDAGTVTFNTAPANGAIGELVYCEFDVPVRFDTDVLGVAYDDFQRLSIQSLPLVEILV